jgi:two-component system, LytTR family, sensor kinase
MERFWRYKLDHVIFWIATVTFHMYTRAHLIDKMGWPDFVLEILVRNTLLAITIYVNLLVLIPRFIYTKKFFAYGISLCLLLLTYAFGKNIHDDLVYGQTNTFYNLSIAMFYVAFSIALQLSRAWYSQRELIRKIEIEKLNTELAYLKSQINPHFLFNSINTIYFLIDKKNTEARVTLSSFSEMLRYQLYECNGHEVPIEKEVQYLKNYIDLQRLRKDENYTINFSSSDQVKGFTIAPLLLICFVENAFKHVSHNNSNNQIEVRLDRINGSFNMTVYNTADNKKHASLESNGIGLKNVKRRLELLYRDRYNLQINESANEFKVNLSLKLENQ